MDFQFDDKKLKFVQRVLNNRVLFKIGLLSQVPLNFVTGIRLREVNDYRLEGGSFLSSSITN